MDFFDKRSRCAFGLSAGEVTVSLLLRQSHLRITTREQAPDEQPDMRLLFANGHLLLKFRDLWRQATRMASSGEFKAHLETPVLGNPKELDKIAVLSTAESKYWAKESRATQIGFEIFKCRPFLLTKCCDKMEIKRFPSSSFWELGLRGLLIKFQNFENLISGKTAKKILQIPI